MTKKDAVFDETKLDWMNGVYIREMGAGAWADAARPWLVEAAALAGKAGDDAARIVATRTPPDPNAPQPEPVALVEQDRVDASAVIAALAHDGEPSTVERMYPLVAERLARLDEIPRSSSSSSGAPRVLLDEKSVEKVLQRKARVPPRRLQLVAASLQTKRRLAGSRA